MSRLILATPPQQNVRVHRIMGVDPGQATGICMVRDGYLIWGQEAHSLSEVVNLIESHHEDVPIDLLVVEDFLGSGVAKDYYDPCVIIGAVAAVAHQLQIPLVMQSPGCQERARKLHGPELNRAHRSRHVRSALAHVWFYRWQHS